MSPEITENSGQMISAATEFGALRHQGQKRKTGEPYFDHCLAVFNIIHDEWGITDEAYLAAALLHDTVEDTGVSVEELTQKFGPEVATLVEGVTKLSAGSEPTQADRRTLHKVIDKTYLNPGVAIIKLADRLHNLRTISGLSPEKQQYKAQETLEVYTRLAESLGMWEVKTELEDLSFAIIDPPTFFSIKNEIDHDSRLDLNFLSYIQSGFEQLLDGQALDGTVEIRRGGIYALAKKREQYALAGKSAPDNFSSLNDLISVRIRLGSVEECYRLIYAIHNVRDRDGVVDYDRYDEFIGANKRDNGYEAIQTTIDYPQGPVEVAVATGEMEDFNRWGILTLIKNGRKNQVRDYSLKIIFTPTGGIRFLPRTATGVDFAYRLNPRLGADATGMVVDGQPRPLSAVVPNSSTVEVLVGPPRRSQEAGLLPYCTMPSTRTEFKRQITLRERDELVAKGSQMMATILTPRGFLVVTDIGDSINSMLYKLGCSQASDLYFKVGGGFITSEQISAELDMAGITKKSLHITTISLRGLDQPGILRDIAGLISQTGRNIEMVNMHNQNGLMDLRLLVKDLPGDQEANLRRTLEGDQRFTECLVV